MGWFRRRPEIHYIDTNLQWDLYAAAADKLTEYYRRGNEEQDARHQAELEEQEARHRDEMGRRLELRGSELHREFSEGYQRGYALGYHDGRAAR